MINRNGDDEKRKHSFSFISLVMSLLKQTKKFHIIAMRIMSERGPSSYHGWVHIPREIRKLEEKESIHSVENITLLQNTCWLASNHTRAYHVKEVHWKKIV